MKKNETQAYLGDIAGLVPDPRSKVSITIKRVTQIFWVPGAYTSYVYTVCSLLSMQWHQV